MKHYKKPQKNDTLERIHQVVGSMVKTKDLANVTFDLIYPWSEILTSIAYAVQWSHHRMIQATPEQLVFGSDMLLDINFQPNYKEMCLRKKKLINYNNKRENAKRVQYNYKVGHYVYILRERKYRKLEGKKLVPFRITQVHNNGYVRIQQENFNEQINIQSLTRNFGDPPT